jgi:hypothetical protein
MADSVTLLLDGEAIPVTHLYDDVGDPVDAWEDATMFVAGPLPSGQWLSAPVAEYRLKRLD